MRKWWKFFAFVVVALVVPWLPLPSGGRATVLAVAVFFALAELVLNGPLGGFVRKIATRTRLMLASLVSMIVMSLALPAWVEMVIVRPGQFSTDGVFLAATIAVASTVFTFLGFAALFGRVGTDD